MRERGGEESFLILYVSGVQSAWDFRPSRLLFGAQRAIERYTTSSYPLFLLFSSLFLSFPSFFLCRLTTSLSLSYLCPLSFAADLQQGNLDNLRAMLSPPLFKHFEKLLTTYKEKKIQLVLNMKPIEEGRSSLPILPFSIPLPLLPPLRYLLLLFNYLFSYHLRIPRLFYLI